jgi:hypothetical protein
MWMDLANRKSEILKSRGMLAAFQTIDLNPAFLVVGTFTQINGNGQFKTAMTMVTPNAKELHKIIQDVLTRYFSCLDLKNIATLTD